MNKECQTCESLRLSIPDLYARYNTWVMLTGNPQERYGELLESLNCIIF